MKRSLTLWSILISTISFSQTGSIGIGTTSPNAGAALEIKSNAKTLLIPRLSTSSLNTVASPVEGMIAYDIDKEKLVTFTGSQAVVLTQSTANFSAYLNSTMLIGQSFMAPGTFLLKNIAVYLVTQNVPTTFTMFLYNGEGITGTIIDSAKISTTGVVSESKNFSFSASNIMLQTGNRYTFQVRADVSPANTAAIAFANTNPYSAGVFYGDAVQYGSYDLKFSVNSSEGGTWQSLFSSEATVNMIAAAYGNVFSNATTAINNSSNNCTLSHTGAGVYEITFTSADLSAIDPSLLAINAALFGNSPGFITFTGSIGKLIIRTFNTAGSPADRGFGFSVFKP